MNSKYRNGNISQEKICVHFIMALGIYISQIKTNNMGITVCSNSSTSCSSPFGFQRDRKITLYTIPTMEMYTAIAVTVVYFAKKLLAFEFDFSRRKVLHNATSIFVRIVKNPKYLIIVSGTEATLFSRIR